MQLSEQSMYVYNILIAFLLDYIIPIYLTIVFQQLIGAASRLYAEVDNI